MSRPEAYITERAAPEPFGPSRNEAVAAALASALVANGLSGYPPTVSGCLAAYRDVLAALRADDEAAGAG